MAIDTRCIATAIGSFPHTDAGQALDIVFRSLTRAPLWPQLPRLGLNEQMEIQYSEGMPRAVIDREKNRMYFDTSGDYSEDFALFYEAYMTAMDPDGGTGDCSAMAISPEFSRGLYEFERRLQAAGKKFPFVKVQTTGPCSFALTIVDENKRAVWYNEEFRDVVVKALAMKCRWQIRKFAPYGDKVICFIDEPILSAFGSSTYIAVKRDEVVAAIAEAVDAVHTEGALAGVHCCGNTDWSILIEAGVDLVNLDAFAYGDTIALYPGAVAGFMNKGGLIAWGIVPTSAAIRDVDAPGLADKLGGLVDSLASKAGLDKQLVLNQSLVTPSCGTGSMAPADAEMVFDKLAALSAHLRGGQ